MQIRQLNAALKEAAPRCQARGMAPGLCRLYRTPRRLLERNRAANVDTTAPVVGVGDAHARSRQIALMESSLEETP